MHQPFRGTVILSCSPAIPPPELETSQPFIGTVLFSRSQAASESWVQLILPIQCYTQPFSSGSTPELVTPQPFIGSVILSCSTPELATSQPYLGHKGASFIQDVGCDVQGLEWRKRRGKGVNVWGCRGAVGGEWEGLVEGRGGVDLLQAIAGLGCTRRCHAVRSLGGHERQGLPISPVPQCQPPSQLHPSPCQPLPQHRPCPLNLIPAQSPGLTLSNPTTPP